MALQEVIWRYRKSFGATGSHLALQEVIWRYRKFHLALQEVIWSYRKFHLALQEVAPLIKRLGQEKKDWDRECGRRSHDSFLPNGSKVLVGSYCHLRREGIEGYISDFNNMVKDLWVALVDIGVEITPDAA